MLVVGIALAWAGYATGFYGYCLIKGYNISFAEVMSPSSWYRGKWPPDIASASVLIPNGKATTGTSTSTSGSGGGGKNPLKCPPGFKLINGVCTNPNQAPGAK